MNSIKRVRKIFGLSQKLIAEYLGVSRSLVSMAEASHRELPVSAVIKLGMLERSLYNNVQYKQPHLQIQAGKDFAAMRLHIKACNHKIRLEKRKLEKLEQKYQCCLQAMMAIDYLQNNLPQGKESKRDKLWLELLQAQSVKKLNSCGLAAQVKIKLTVQALEMQAAQAEAMKF